MFFFFEIEILKFKFSLVKLPAFSFQRNKPKRPNC